MLVYENDLTFVGVKWNSSFFWFPFKITQWTKTQTNTNQHKFLVVAFSNYQQTLWCIDLNTFKI